MADRRSLRSPSSPQVALIAVLALAVVIGLWLGRPRSIARLAPQPESAADPTKSALNRQGGSSGPGAGGGTPAPEEHIPTPPCWEGLLALDEGGSLDDLLAALALTSDDSLLREYLQERLAQAIGDSSAAALTVIGRAVKAGPPLTGYMLEALKRAPAAQQPKVAEKLLDLGVDGAQSHELRRAALDALDSQHRLPTESIQRLKAVALDDQADEIGWVAARTMGRVMVEDYQRTGHFTEYWHELLDVGHRSTDAAVRSLALEMPSYGDIPVDSGSIDQLSRILKTDPDRQVREMAAFRLGLSREPERALQAFRESFAGESDLCVRWAIFRFAVRAAGAKALPLLAQLATAEPRLRPDYEDFRALYQSGTVDFVRVWLGKPERIQCLDEGE